MEQRNKALLKHQIKKYLEFRRLFTPREWFELEQAVKFQFNKKADQLTLDDSDIEEILNNRTLEVWLLK